MIYWALNFLMLNKILILLVYWLPLAFCAVFYFIRTMNNYIDDRRRREKASVSASDLIEKRSYYTPTDTIGTLIGRAFITILPVGNVCAAIFDLAPDVFAKFFKWVSKVFDQPLVPKRKTEDTTKEMK